LATSSNLAQAAGTGPQGHADWFAYANTTAPGAVANLPPPTVNLGWEWLTHADKAPAATSQNLAGRSGNQAMNSGSSVVENEKPQASQSSAAPDASKTEQNFSGSHWMAYREPKASPSPESAKVSRFPVSGADWLARRDVKPASGLAAEGSKTNVAYSNPGADWLARRDVKPAVEAAMPKAAQAIPTHAPELAKPKTDAVVEDVPVATAPAEKSQAANGESSTARAARMLGLKETIDINILFRAVQNQHKISPKLDELANIKPYFPEIEAKDNSLSWSVRAIRLRAARESLGSSHIETLMAACNDERAWCLVRDYNGNVRRVLVGEMWFFEDIVLGATKFEGDGNTATKSAATEATTTPSKPIICNCQPGAKKEVSGLGSSMWAQTEEARSYRAEFPYVCVDGSRHNNEECPVLKGILAKAKAASNLKPNAESFKPKSAAGRLPRPGGLSDSMWAPKNQKY
jgi:hypothetical protein